MSDTDDRQDDIWSQVTDTQLGFVRLWMECISRQLHTSADGGAACELIRAQSELGFQCSKALLDQSGKVLDSLFGAVDPATGLTRAVASEPADAAGEQRPPQPAYRRSGE